MRYLFTLILALAACDGADELRQETTSTTAAVAEVLDIEAEADAEVDAETCNKRCCMRSAKGTCLWWSKCDGQCKPLTDTGKAAPAPATEAD